MRGAPRRRSGQKRQSTHRGSTLDTRKRHAEAPHACARSRVASVSDHAGSTAAPPRGAAVGGRRRGAPWLHARAGPTQGSRARAPPGFHSCATRPLRRATRRSREHRGGARVRRAALRWAQRLEQHAPGRALCTTHPSQDAPPRRTQPPGGAGTARPQREQAARRRGSGRAEHLASGVRFVSSRAQPRRRCQHAHPAPSDMRARRAESCRTLG